MPSINADEFRAGAGRGKPLCKVRRTGDQAITTSSLTAVEFTVADANKWGMFNSSQDTRITILYPGFYLLTAPIFWEANDTGSRFLNIRKNGSQTMIRDRRNAVSSSEAGVSVLADMDRDDYIELMVFQDSGGNLNTGGGVTGLAALWVAPL